MHDFLRSIWRTRDWPAVLLLVLIASTASWIGLLPINRTVQQISLERFHLATPGFAGWALQQPVPSMYNFENRYWISDRPPSANEHWNSVSTASAARPDSRYVNHFPTRIFTFGDGRVNLLYGTTTIQYLCLHSRYRREELNSVWAAIPDLDGGFELQRMTIGRDTDLGLGLQPRSLPAPESGIGFQPVIFLDPQAGSLSHDKFVDQIHPSCF